MLWTSLPDRHGRRAPVPRVCRVTRAGSMDGSLHASGVMNRWLSIVRTAEIAVILGSAIVIVASLGQQIWKTRQARRDLHTLGRLGHFNWTMDHGKRCPPDAVAIARHMGCGRTVDPWGTPYQLACSEDEPHEKGLRFVVFSAGPDRIAGTRDDIYLTEST